LPWDDVAKHLLEAAGGGSFCEWKGPATYWSLVSSSLSDLKPQDIFFRQLQKA